MQCPHDGSPLKPKTYEADVQVDLCDKCGGMWLQKGELERIQATIENDYRAELGGMPHSTRAAYEMARGRMEHDDLTCPECEGQLIQKEHGMCSQVWVDVCIQCGGVWLDEGELKELEVFFEQAKIETRDIRKGFWASLRDLVMKGIVPNE